MAHEISFSPSKNRDSIAQFSKKDAQIYDQYNNEMEKLADAITFMIDAAPLEKSSRFGEKLNTAKQIHKLAKTVNYEFSQLHEVCLDSIERSENIDL